MQEYGFNSVLCEAGPCRSKDDLKDDIWKMRWYLMLTLTHFGLSVLVVDADIVFLGDPTKEFFGDADMEVMTDHFFPAKHLWEPWVRVEDHINTGFVLVKPTRPIRFLIADFLDENWQSEQGGVRRDGMDQRVFNHFIARGPGGQDAFVFDPFMKCVTLAEVGRYDDKVFGRRQSIVPAWPWRQAEYSSSEAPGGKHGRGRQDPARIAHGMNFFWRRAHLLDPKAGQALQCWLWGDVFVSLTSHLWELATTQFHFYIMETPAYDGSLYKTPAVSVCSEAEALVRKLSAFDGPLQEGDMGFLERNVETRKTGIVGNWACATQIGRLPAVAHVNGADPKEYFLRDRQARQFAECAFCGEGPAQVWLQPGWPGTGFSVPERFLTYDHPGGQSLQGDFSALSAAVEACTSLIFSENSHNGCGRLAGREDAEATSGASRHHELPGPQPLQRTQVAGEMTGGSIGWVLTGRNAPSYYAWSLNITVQGETESWSPKGSREGKVPNAHISMHKGGNCTFDYFSWATWLHRRAKNLLDAHVGFVIELLPQSVALRGGSIRYLLRRSGVRKTPEFVQLVEDAASHLDHLDDACVSTPLNFSDFQGVVADFPSFPMSYLVARGLCDESAVSFSFALSCTAAALLQIVPACLEYAP
ncbi:unnamed protein product [Symbiodinium sp. CCMP2456]|nr:unnamed protein product [Symbiodinium sp. CCMP2456]